MKKIISLIKKNGLWSIYAACSLLQNRILVFTQRILLRNPEIYFQGSPRIIGRKNIKFGKNFCCGKGAWIEAISKEGNENTPTITFGDNFSASENFHIAAIKKISIGSNVLVGSNVLITDHSHGNYSSTDKNLPAIPPNERQVFSKGEIIICDNVWIADGVKILPGVTIGFGAVISANSIVRENVPENSIFGPLTEFGVYKKYGEIEF